jgi:surfactin synthase thioesterase subunit
LDRPSELVVFGHSMGALLAYELVARLEVQGTAATLLVASASRCPRPCLRNPRRSRSCGDEELLDVAFQPELPEAYSHHFDQLRSLMLPVLQADLAMCRRYTPAYGMLHTPILALVGTEDHLVTSEDAQGWAGLTGESSLMQVSGDHYFIHTSTREIIDALRSTLATRQRSQGLATRSSIEVRNDTQIRERQSARCLG